MKSTFTAMVILCICSYCTANVGVPAFLAQLASGLSHLPGLGPPGVAPIPAGSLVKNSKSPAVGVPKGAPFGQLPGGANLPFGKLPGGANLPFGNLPGGANLPTGSLPVTGLPGVPSVGKKILKPKPTAEKLEGHQNCLETYFNPCASGELMYCYILHLCAKMYY